MMRWSYRWHAAAFRHARRVREVDSRVADFLWYALLIAAGALVALAHLCRSPIANLTWGEVWHVVSGWAS